MIKWKEEMGLTGRGLKLVRKVCPGLLAVTVLQSVFAALAPFVTIYMSSVIINGIEEGMERGRLLSFAAAAVSVNLAVHLLGSLFGRLVNSRRSRFWTKCQMILGSKMMEMDYMDIESARIHQLRQQIEDSRNMEGAGLENILLQFQQMVGNAFTVAFSVSFVLSLFTVPFEGDVSGILALAVSPAASVLMALAMVVNASAGMFFSKKMAQKSHLLLQDSAGANRIYGYYVENHIMNYHTGKDVRIYDQKGLLKEEAMQVYDVGVRMVKGQVQNEAKYAGAAACMGAVLSALVYLFVGFRALAGMIGVGEIVLYAGSISRFTQGFSGVVGAFARLLANNDTMRLYFEFLDTPVRMARAAGDKTFSGGGEHEVEFRDVSFRYPGSEEWALRHICVKFRAGERLAVVGRNGSGKTTFIKLLCRLYDPEEGSILLDGVDIREYDLKEYRAVFSVVFQDFKLFSFSLAQNVAAGLEADPARTAECLEKAGLGQRLLQMPSGADTCLYRDFEEEGVEVSGGEAQKIALARALYKNAPIVVLDEPTAALDPAAEYDIYSRFNDIVGDKTAVYISHRLSSCKFCDRIIVFHMGKLVQTGSHRELAEDKNGVYYELWNAQAQHYM